MAGRVSQVVLGGAIALVVACAGFPGSAGAVIPLPIHPTRTDDPSSGGTSCNPNPALDTDCSLRNALMDATVDGASVSLGSPSPTGPYDVTQSTPLTISHNINLVGVGARSSTIVRTAAFSAGVLQITSGVTVGATVQGVTITGGQAVNGGGIENDGVLTLRDSTITGNQASVSGGGIDSPGTLTVTGSTISLNTSTNAGGGAILGGVAVVLNTTISDNSSVGSGQNGGGLFVVGGSTVRLANVTVSSNRAPFAMGGGNLLIKAPMSARNTIIAGGMSGSGPGNCIGTQVITSQGYNLEDGNSCGLTGPGDQINTDPMLGGLQDNGGPTDTRALSVGSPAVDHGNPDGCTDPSTTLLMVDQRGLPRPQGLACDIGAYELQPVAPAVSALPATGVGTGGATLNGTVDTHGFPTTWWFEYGPTTASGASTPAQNLASGTQPVSAMITGLLPGATYHFALVARTAGGSVQTFDQTFTTSGSPGGAPGGGQPPGGSPGGGQPPGGSPGGGQPPGPRARGAVAPVLGPIAIVPAAFRAAGIGASIATRRVTGATVTYTDTERSIAAFTVLRARPGVTLRGRCAPPPKRPVHKHGHACTRYVAVGGFTHSDASGLNRFRFTGRVGGHKLPPGNYKLNATPRSNGKAGTTVSAHFRILR
jgi:hypothetical protein